ncbi:hypothetical protein O181_019874 [Austropuccinia psidii MF-1]|uniref:Integrase catalytic domain-containing protein n=1 Tax=Austropuccinia psidii MF-1 TaxID=1389203 RepID=A0A9Q3GV62_9BASI|nr:hypothetical protein [Austropuccinia psidii MF-1]
MFNNKDFFDSLSFSVKINIATGDINSTLIACGIGTVNLTCNNKIIRLENCLFIPKLKCNLISLLELFKNQLVIHRQGSKFKLESNNEIILDGNIVDRLMYINYNLPKSLLTTNNKESDIWHNRLGHPGISVLKSMGLPTDIQNCLVCQINRSHKLPYSNHFEEAKFPLDCLHLDLVGPISPTSLSGCSYILTMIDQATGFKMIRFLKRKSEAFQHFLSAKRLMQNKQDRKLKKLVSDRGETPQHNGYAERANRTILEKARCLINPTNLPKTFWAEAINTAVFLSNLSPTVSQNNKSPHLLWYNTPGKINRLKTFGCRAVIFNHHKHRDWKLAPPGSEGIFLGYENENTSYRILRLHDSKIIITRNATFNEKIFPRINSGSNTAPEETKWAFLTSNTELINEDGNEHLTEEMEGIEEFPTSESLGVSVMEDEVLSDDLNGNSSEIPNQSRIKIIGPRHPTLITSKIDQLNVLPYSRRGNALFSASIEIP